MINGSLFGSSINVHNKKGLQMCKQRFDAKLSMNRLRFFKTQLYSFERNTERNLQGKTKMNIVYVASILLQNIC